MSFFDTEDWKKTQKKWQIARFFTLYCNCPTTPEEISDETIRDWENLGKDKEESIDISLDIPKNDL